MQGLAKMKRGLRRFVRTGESATEPVMRFGIGPEDKHLRKFGGGLPGTIRLEISQAEVEMGIGIGRVEQNRGDEMPPSLFLVSLLCKAKTEVAVRFHALAVEPKTCFELLLRLRPLRLAYQSRRQA